MDIISDGRKIHLKRKILALVTVVALCFTMMSTTVSASAASSPDFSGILYKGTLNIIATGLSTDVKQVIFLATNKANNADDPRMETAVPQNGKATMTFTNLTGTDYTVSVATKTSPAQQTTLGSKDIEELAATYRTHVQKMSWLPYVSGGATSGTMGKSLRVEAIQIKLPENLPKGASISYKAYVQRLGWLNEVSDNGLAGTAGKGLRLEAIKITLKGLTGFHVKYRAYVQRYKWLNWQTVENGTAIDSAPIAGTMGKSLRIEAIQIVIEN